MKNTFGSMLQAAVFGSVFVLPFALLEYVNTKGYMTHGFPAALIGTMWLLGSLFTIVLFAILRAGRSGSISEHPLKFAFGGLFLVAVALIWGGLVNDQMPCFLGVPNCD